MKLIDAHVFCLENKTYLFDYRNLLVFEINSNMQKRLDVNSDNKVLYISDLEEFTRCGLFCDDVENEFVENDSEVAYLSLPTIHSCNMRCRYCFADAGMKYKDEEKTMTLERLNEILSFFFSEFEQCSKYRIDFVSGGEPLLNFRVIQETYNSVKAFDNRDVMIWLATNGLLLKNQIIEYMDNNNIQFGISIDGTKESHDKNRVDINGNGTFEQIVKNIKAIKENSKYKRNTKDIWVLTTITSETKSLIDILSVYKKLGIRRVQMKIVRTNKKNMYGLNMKTLDCFIELYKELIVFLKKEILEDRLDTIEMIMNRNDMFGKVLISLLLREPCITRCMAGREKISVSANGHIYPCESFLGIEKFCIGNIFEGISANNSFTKLNVYSQEKCKDCWAKYICGGGCYYRNFVETGNIENGSEAYCLFYKKLIEMTIDFTASIQENEEIYKKIEKVAIGKRKMEW